jgi:selT/selW/selH-like putative selenoprotein
LEKAFPGKAECELVPASGGVFEVSVDGRKIFSKRDLDRFPAYQEIPLLLM